VEANLAKRALLAGRPALGAPVTLGNPLAAETLARLGFDFVLVDMQHGCWSLDTAAAAMRGIVLGGSIPMARVQKNDFFAIGSVLDRGAMGLVIPMVNNAAEAASAAFAARFPPRGGRSQGGAGTAFLRELGYERWIDAELFLAVQIETKEGLEHAEEILSVDGVDGCWIGPADLANSLGLDLALPADRAKHEEAIMAILAVCKKCGKIPGIAGGLDAAKWIARGFQFVTTAADLTLLALQGRAVLEQLRAAAAGH